MNRVSETALTVARQRAFAEIDGAKEIYDQLTERTGSFGEDISLRSTPIIEARTRLLDRLVGEENVEQVIELAAGFSPRARTMLNGGTAVRTYVEVELSGVASIREGQMRNVSGFHLVAGDVTEKSDLNKALEFVDSNPVALINEGLLRYLNFDQKRIVASWAHEMLTRYGGVWVTSDISQLSVICEEQTDLNEYKVNFRNATGHELENVVFEDIEHARKFFSNIGFGIEEHKFTEIIEELASPKKLNMNDDDVKKMLNNAVVFVMRIPE